MVHSRLPIGFHCWSADMLERLVTGPQHVQSAGSYHPK